MTNCLTAPSDNSKIVEENVFNYQEAAMPNCCVCGNPVEGYPSKMVHNVKCDKCRKTPSTRKKVWEDTDTQIACRECGVLRRRLDRHLTTFHKMTVQEYLDKHPGALVDVPGTRTRSDACRAKQSEAATQRWTSEEERQAQSERLTISAPWKGKHLSEEHRAAVSAGGLGVPHNVSVENRKKMGGQGKKALEEIRLRPEYPELLRTAIYKRILREGDKFGLISDESHRKSLASRIRNGTLIPPGGGRGITGFRKGIDHYCRSTLEANFARILIYEKILYEYEPTVFVLPSGKRWTPDFRLLAPLKDLLSTGWVELKGWRKSDGTYAFGASKKIEDFQEMTGEPVYVLCMQDLLWKQLEQVYQNLVLWEKPNYNLRSHPEVFGK